MAVYFLEKQEICAGLAASKRLLVAVSGGADSLFLLLSLNRLKEDFGWTLAVAHVNHGLRGETADLEEAFVEAWAKRLRLPFFSRKLDIKSLNMQMKKGLEAAGREARYSFFIKAGELWHADALVLGHQSDDQTENFFLRLLRGTSVMGLLAMKKEMPVSEYLTLFRPLLDYRQEEIKEFLESQGIIYCEDETNYGTEHRRSKFRQELIPYLQKYNPQIHESVRRLQKQMAYDEEFMNSHLAQLTKNIQLDPFGYFSAPLETLSQWPKALLGRYLNSAFYQLAGQEEGIQFRHIEEILLRIDNPPPYWQITLPQNLVALISSGMLFILKEEEAEFSFKSIESMSLTHIFSSPFSKFLPEFNCTLQIQEVNKSKRKTGGVFGSKLFEEYNEFYLRTFMPGDDLIFADGKSKKLSDYFQERRVPIPWRKSMPLFCQEGRIVLIPNHYVAKEWQPGEKDRCFVLSVLGSDRE